MTNHFKAFKTIAAAFEAAMTTEQRVAWMSLPEATRKDTMMRAYWEAVKAEAA